MKGKISLPNGTNYKYLTILIAVYMAIVLLTMFIENRMISLFSYNVVTGTLIIPFSYTLSDIITEVYGYQVMKKIMWSCIFVLYIVSLIIYIVMLFPAPITTQVQNHAYEIVFQPFARDVFTYSIAAITGIFLNSYIISKWKILIQGQLFWMRSLGSSAVGEITFTLIFGIIAFWGVYSFKDIISIICFSFIYKLICNLVTIIPSSIFVSFLKRSENMDVYDRDVAFNPFVIN